MTAKYQIVQTRNDDDARNLLKVTFDSVEDAMTTIEYFLTEIKDQTPFEYEIEREIDSVTLFLNVDGEGDQSIGWTVISMADGGPTEDTFKPMEAPILENLKQIEALKNSNGSLEALQVLAKRIRLADKHASTLKVFIHEGQNPDTQSYLKDIVAKIEQTISIE